MRFTIEQRFRARLTDVEDAYVSPELLATLATLPKVGGAELLEQRHEAGHVFQRVRYRFTAELSAAVTAVVDPAKLTWVEESMLDRATHVTTWKIVADHYGNRLDCRGEFALREDGGGTVRRTDAEIKVRFPLVGGRVEKAIVAGLEQHAEAEQAAVEAYMTAFDH
ncbi:MAG TPA: DUF2505 family protein [Acidimicrobiales bacterium]|nr:DUF2505 family protein [Acidimicrobiales bacterium]